MRANGTFSPYRVLLKSIAVGPIFATYGALRPIFSPCSQNSGLQTPRRHTSAHMLLTWPTEYGLPVDVVNSAYLILSLNNNAEVMKYVIQAPHTTELLDASIRALREGPTRVVRSR